MSARELSRNNATRYCLFYIDSYDSDGEKLPTSQESGKNELSSSSPCSYGSIAKDASGHVYILTGDDKWVLHNNSNSGSSGSQPQIEWEEL